MRNILRNVLKGAAMLACLGLLAAPAEAQVEAALGASQPYYTLTDMRDDGVAAAVRFLPGTSSMFGQMESRRDGKALHAEYPHADDQQVTEISADWEGRIGMRAEQDPGADFLAAGRAEAFANPGGYLQHYASANLDHGNDFELAPHTMLSVSVDFLLGLRASPLGAAGDSASVQASMYLGFYDAHVGDYDDSYLSDWAGRYRTEIDRNETMSVAVLNDSDEWARGRFDLSLESWVQISAAPVPESPAWGMYAGGLLAGGLLARQRKKRRRSASFDSTGQA